VQAIGRNQRLITSNHVVGESYTLLRMRLGQVVAQEFLWRLRTSAVARRVFVLEAWEDEAEALLSQFADQDFSFVDATSFVVMRKLGLREAFAYDHDFQVAGFVLAAVQ
jgi:predicted nucleic acid-binding protein